MGKTTMGRICMQMAEEIGITVPPMDPIHAEETLTPLIYRCIPRDQAGQLLSIGSIPHFCGEACVGPCRFHRKGKCFDGPLRRFCHMEGPHPGAVKKVPKKSRKVKKAPLKNGMPGQVGVGNDQTALRRSSLRWASRMTSGPRRTTSRRTEWIRTRISST